MDHDVVNEVISRECRKSLFKEIMIHEGASRLLRSTPKPTC